MEHFTVTTLVCSSDNSVMYCSVCLEQIYVRTNTKFKQCSEEEEQFWRLVNLNDWWKLIITPLCLQPTPRIKTEIQTTTLSLRN